MPRDLLERCRPDSIDEFRSSARQRFLDGLAAEAAGRRTAAIYLWGYSAEMTIKAAYFEAIGFDREQAIVANDLKGAVARGERFEIRWSARGRYHDVRAWASLLIAEHAEGGSPRYQDRHFRESIRSMAVDLGRFWNVELRYHRNIARPQEVRLVRRAAAWFLDHAQVL